MSDLAYTDTMIEEIRELLLNARQKVATHINTELLSAGFTRLIKFNRQCLLN